MSLIVREMRLEEVGVIVDYFHQATPEHLELMGVDPTRLPEREKWVERYAGEYCQPLEKRKSFLIIWKLDDAPIGFSTSDRIVLGQEARMHLHILSADNRRMGYGTACVRETVKIYFDVLGLQRLYCEPNAFNVAPNRTLQNVGFKYLKTYYTVPGVLNYHQAVNRWVLEK